MSKATISSALVQLLVAWRWFFLIVAVSAAAGALIIAPNLPFDRSLRALFADDDPRLAESQQLSEFFHGDSVVWLVYDDPGLLDGNGYGIELVETVTQRVRETPGVECAISLSTLNDALRALDPAEPTAAAPSEPAADTRAPILYSDHAEALRRHFTSITHDADERRVVILCLLTPESHLRVSRLKTVRGLQQIAEEQAGGIVVGEPVTVAGGFQLIQRDDKKLVLIAAVCSLLVLLISFRSFRWTIVPLCAAVLTLAITQGILRLIDVRLTMLSVGVRTLIVVMAVGAGVYIITRFEEGRMYGHSHEGAVKWTLGTLLGPMTWTFLAAAAGFVSLAIADVQPIREFGITMALASGVLWLTLLMVTPGIAMLGSQDADPGKLPGDDLLQSLLVGVLRLVRRQRWLVSAALVALVAASVLGMLRLVVATDFIRNFHSASGMAASVESLESTIGGSGLIDVVVPLSGAVPQHFHRLNAMQDELRQLAYAESSRPALARVFSIADVERALSEHPQLAGLSPDERFATIARIAPTLTSALVSEQTDSDGNRYARIMLWTRHARPSAEQTWLAQRVREIVFRHFPPSEGAARTAVSGFFLLIADLVSTLMADLCGTLILAVALVLAIVTFAVRSLWYGLVAVVPLGLGIVPILGGMGWIGMPVGFAIVMAGAAGLGLGAATTIFYVRSYLGGRFGGRSVAAATEIAQRRVGRVAVVSTLAMVIGLGALATSNYVPVTEFGILVSLSLAGSLAASLTVLPIMLEWVDARRRLRMPRHRQRADDERATGVRDETAHDALSGQLASP